MGHSSSSSLSLGPSLPTLMGASFFSKISLLTTRTSQSQCVYNPFGDNPVLVPVPVFASFARRFPIGCYGGKCENATRGSCVAGASINMSYSLQRIDNKRGVDEAIRGTVDKVVVLRFGRETDMVCMQHDDIVSASVFLKPLLMLL